MGKTVMLKKCLRGIIRWGIRLGLCALVLFTGAFLGAFAPQIYHHFVLFPKQAATWKALDAQRTPVSLKTGWNEYRGVMHSHSEVSHDSLVEFPHIVEAMHKAKCQFILMSDHVVDGKADYSLGWKGMHDGVLFVRGFEMNNGFMPWGLPDGTVLDAKESPPLLAKRIHDLGGVICIAHAEIWRDWDIPEIDGMEIYNIHTDMMDDMADPRARLEAVKDVLLNMHSFGDQTLRSLYDFTVPLMLTYKWDQMNRHRHLTAIAANDCHQNVGIRGIYTGRDTFMLIDTGHDEPKHKVWEHTLNPITRFLLKTCFGSLSPEKELFRIDLDPYERSSRFVNTHLLAKELTEPALLDALRAGRAFVAFNMLADASGFAYVAQANGQQVTMGESIPLAPGLKLLAEAPLACRFTLMRDGLPVTSQDGKTFEYAVTEPGKYRIQANLKMPGEMALTGESFANNMATWILTNPIEITAQAAPPAP